METFVTLRIDPQDIFDDLTSNEQRDLLLDNLSILSDDDLVDELESRDYIVNLERP